VDTTHIEFARRDATGMFNAVRVVGQLKAENLEYRQRRPDGARHAA